MFSVLFLAHSCGPMMRFCVAKVFELFRRRLLVLEITEAAARLRNRILSVIIVLFFICCRATLWHLVDWAVRCSYGIWRQQWCHLQGLQVKLVARAGMMASHQVCQYLLKGYPLQTALAMLLGPCWQTVMPPFQPRDTKSRCMHWPWMILAPYSFQGALKR